MWQFTNESGSKELLEWSNALLARPAIPELLREIVVESQSAASAAHEDLSRSGLLSVPEPLPTVDDAAVMLTTSCSPETMLRALSASIAHSIAGLRMAFPEDVRHLVASEFLIDERLTTRSPAWRAIYRHHAPSVALIEPYGLAGSEFAALAAARAGHLDPHAPNLIIVPPLPALMCYDGLGHLVARGGVIIDHNGSLHSGIFPTPIPCRVAVPGSNVVELESELTQHGVVVIGSRRSLERGFSKFEQKELLYKAGVKAPRAILVRDGDPSAIGEQVRRFLNTYPKNRGVVVKPDGEAHGTGVVIFDRNPPRESLVASIRTVVKQFGCAVVEERIPSFSLSSSTGMDCNFRVLRAPREARWIGIEVRASDHGEAVNLFTGASAYRFNPAAIMNLTGLPLDQAERLFDRLYRILDDTSKKVADAIGGDVVAIDVIIDNHFVPYVNEAATSLGGGIGTLATLDGSLPERLQAGNALFAYLAGRAVREDRPLASPMARDSYESRAAASSVKSAAWVGFHMLDGDDGDTVALVARALHRCLSSSDTPIRILSRDAHYHNMIEQLTLRGERSFIGRILRDLGPSLESMPHTLCAVAAFEHRLGDPRRGQSLIEGLQERWRPESKVGQLIGSVAQRLGVRDNGYWGTAFRARLANLKPDLPQRSRELLGLSEKFNSRGRLETLVRKKHDPFDLIQEAEYWRHRGQFKLSFSIASYALFYILTHRPEFTHTNEMLYEVNKQLKALEPYFSDNADPDAKRSWPLTWRFRRLGERMRMSIAHIVLRRALRREWKPHHESRIGTLSSRLSNLLTVLTDALGTRSR